MGRRILLGLLLVVLALASGCSRPPAGGLPATVVWHRAQDRISPAAAATNSWEGFRTEKDGFTAERNIAQFIVWRDRSETVPVTIEYSLQGGRGLFTVNDRKNSWLEPGPAYKKKRSEFFFSRGMNFLQFTKKSKDKLRIRSIVIGAATKQAGPRLRRGESFDLFLRPGRGRLVLGGRGRVEVVEQAGDGESVPPTRRRLKSGWLSGRISVPFAFTSPGLLTVTALEGDLEIRSYQYAARREGREAPAAATRGNPDVYIVLSDACQASHLGAYGYPRPTSAHIDDFARDAMVYENAYTNAVFTRSSVATLLTGLYPDSHRVRLLQSKLPKQLLTLPEFLKAKGYSSSMITSTFAVSPEFGFTQGVDFYFRLFDRGQHRRETSIVDHFGAWLQAATGPAFSYMHFIHPHFPKVPPPGFPVSFLPGNARPAQERMTLLVHKLKRTGVQPTPEDFREITDIYDSSIAWMDGEFGKVLERIKGQKRYDESLIVFLADHGEALGEHGVLGHGSNVYEETARVPLIVKYPASMGRKGRERRLVELADVFPTLAALFGQRLEMDGRSMLPPHPGGEEDERIVVARTLNRSGKYGLRWKDWYYIFNLGDNRERLFALAVDPLTDVGDRHPRAKAFLKARFLDWYARFRDLPDYSIQMNLKNLPAAEIEEMKTLGYL
jgi:arylsulfatase A-like enzyme